MFPSTMRSKSMSPSWTSRVWRRAACRGSRHRPARGGRARGARGWRAGTARAGPAAASVCQSRSGRHSEMPNVATAGNCRAELLLEGLGDTETGGHDPGRCGPVAVRRLSAHWTTPPAQPRQVRWRRGLPVGSAGLPSARVGRSAASWSDDLPAVAGHHFGGSQACHPAGGHRRVSVEMDVNSAEVGPMPRVHDGGQRRLCRQIVLDPAADGDLQDQGLQVLACLARVAGLAGVDEDLGCAVDLVGRPPAHTSLRMNRRRAASWPVQDCQSRPSYRCTPTSAAGATRIAKSGMIRATWPFWATIGFCGVDAALLHAASGMRVDVSGHDSLLGIADVPELAVGQAVDLDAAGQAVRVEVIQVDDAGHGAPVAGSVSKQERA